METGFPLSSTAEQNLGSIDKKHFQRNSVISRI